MKIRSMTMTAACVLTGALALVGCSSNTGGNGGGGTSASAGSTAAANAGSTAQAGSTGGSGSTSGNSGSSGNNGESTGSNTGTTGYATCQASSLKIALSGQNPVSGGQVTQWVQLSNATSTPCTMDGFAGVNLVGSARGQSNYSWSLERDNEKYSKLTLKPGEAAYFGITYLAWMSADSAPINVTKIELTPPNTTTTITLPFSASIVLQDEATRPGTFLTPIALGTGA
jgi:hypothetical protein